MRNDNPSPIADKLATQIADADIALSRTYGCAIEARGNVVGFGEKTETITSLSAVAILKHHLLSKLGCKGEGREQSVGELTTDTKEIVLFLQLEHTGL